MYNVHIATLWIASRVEQSWDASTYYVWESSHYVTTTVHYTLGPLTTRFTRLYEFTTMVFMCSLVFTDLTSLKSDSVWSSILNCGRRTPMTSASWFTIWSGVSECKRVVVRFSSGWGKCLILWRKLGPGVGSKVAFPVSHWNHWIFYSEPQVRVRPTLWVSKCLWCPVPSVCSGLYYYTILRGSKSQPLITKKRWKKSEFFGWLIG